jgi:putative phage cell wall hydrolase
LNRDLDLIIKTQKGPVAPAILDGACWDTERKGTPGKFTFKCIFDELNQFEEGDLVTVKYKNEEVFYGFVFTISRDRDKILSVTAYDQLRYLKNKDIFYYKNRKASDVLKMICNKFRLSYGEIEDTQYVIGERLEDNVALFDVILTALNLTLQNTERLYVIYDDFGKITLKDVESLKLNEGIFIDETISENFSYSSTIDKTYNKIKLTRENKEKGVREIFLSPNTEAEIKNHTYEKWGILQYYDRVDEKENPQVKADSLLKLYNRKFKSLSIKNVFGNVKVRAGVSIVVKLDLGDIKVSNYMLVESVKHTFNKDEHFMDLKLRGADIE